MFFFPPASSRNPCQFWLLPEILYSFISSNNATGFDPGGRRLSAAFPLGKLEYGQSSDPSKPEVEGTAGGGPMYIDHLVTTYNCSLILSYNYAVGGTVVDTDVVKGSSPDLQHEIPISHAKRESLQKTGRLPFTELHGRQRRARILQIRCSGR